MQQPMFTTLNRCPARIAAQGGVPLPSWPEPPKAEQQFILYGLRRCSYVKGAFATHTVMMRVTACTFSWRGPVANPQPHS